MDSNITENKVKGKDWIEEDNGIIEIRDDETSSNLDLNNPILNDVNLKDEKQNLKEVKQEIENVTYTKNFKSDTPRRSSHSRRSISQSLFDINIPNEDTTNGTKSNYEERLSKEAQDWANILYETRQNIKRLEAKSINIDESILSEEQKVYFRNSKINFEELEKKSIEFQTKSIDYLQKHSDLMETHDYTLSLCMELFDNLVRDSLQQFLI